MVQLVLEEDQMSSATSKLLLSQFEGNYVHLSRQKFSSHVVEKCLWVCNEEVQSKIIHELLNAPNFGRLIQDPHANYVLQTALEVAEVHHLLKLLNLVSKSFTTFNHKVNTVHM